jgi:hypothetical protein
MSGGWRSGRGNAAPCGILGSGINAAAGIGRDVNRVSSRDGIKRGALDHDFVGHTGQDQHAAAGFA